MPAHVIRRMLGHKGHTGVGMHWTCHLLHRIFRRCWQNLQLCGAEHAHVDEVLIDQLLARPAVYMLSWVPMQFSHAKTCYGLAGLIACCCNATHLDCKCQ